MLWPFGAPQLPVTAAVVVLGALLAVAPPLPLGIGFSHTARAAEAIASQEINVTNGVIAEITQCRRKEGVLTIRMKLHNTTNQQVSVSVISGRNYDDFYVTAKNKKYFVLRDTEKDALTPSAGSLGDLSVTLKQGSSWTWWAQYPAPPPDVTSITFFTPLTAPFEDLRVTD
jgi:hypothetical protein